MPVQMSWPLNAMRNAPNIRTQITLAGWSAQRRWQSNRLIEANDGLYSGEWKHHSLADADDRIGSKHPTVKPIDLDAVGPCGLVAYLESSVLDTAGQPVIGPRPAECGKVSARLENPQALPRPSLATGASTHQNFHAK